MDSYDSVCAMPNTSSVVVYSSPLLFSHRIGEKDIAFGRHWDSDTHTYVQRGKCIFKLYVQQHLYKGDTNQRQARWEIRHNIQQFCVFLDFLYVLAQKQVVSPSGRLYYTGFPIHVYRRTRTEKGNVKVHQTWLDSPLLNDILHLGAY